MADALRITYQPLPGATPEGERVALAQAYSIILDNFTTERKAAGISGGEDDAKRRSNEIPAKTILP